MVFASISRKSNFIRNGGRNVCALYPRHEWRGFTARRLRPKFRDLFTAEEALDFVNEIKAQSLTVQDPKIDSELTPDPKDDYLVALVQSQADFLVSGDSHLTELKRTDISVFTPREMLEKLKPN